MPNNDFYLQEQTEILAALIYYNVTDFDWHDFILNTEKIIQIICDVNDVYRVIYYLDNYTLHMFDCINYEDQFKLAKKRVEYFCSYPLDARYHIREFKLEDREELLKIAIKNSIKMHRMDEMNLSVFNLPFAHTVNILMKYPVMFTSILKYLNEFIDEDFYLIKKKAILRLLSITEKSIEEKDCIFLKEEHRVEILNILAKKRPKQVANNIKNFKISDPFTRLTILVKVIDNLLDFNDFIENLVNFELSIIPGIIGKLTMELEQFFASKVDLNFDLIYAELIKFKIFDNHLRWMDDRNQEIFGKEVSYLKKYEIIDEFTGYKFLIITNWLIFTIILSNALNVTNVLIQHINIAQKVFKEIRSFSDSKMRFMLSKLTLIRIFNEFNVCSLYCDFFRKKSQILLLPGLIIISYVPVMEILNNMIFINEILYKIQKNNKKYKDGKHMRLLIFGLQSVFSNTKINYEDKFLLTAKILSYDIMKQKNCYWLIQSILALTLDNADKFKELHQIIMRDDIQSVFQAIFMHLFKIYDNNLMSNYEKSFGNKHNQAALLIYYTKMQLLPENQKIIMLNVLNQYVNSVLSDNFIEYYVLRYNVNSNNQLKLIFDHYPDLKVKWQEGYAEDYEKFIQDHELINIEDKEFDLSEFLISRIIKHQHLPLCYREYFQKYVELQVTSQVDESEKLAIENNLQQQINLMLEGHVVDPNVISYRLQLALINVIKLNSKDPQKQFSCLMEISRYIPNNVNIEFSTDLYYAARKLIRRSVYKKMNFTGWKIIDTDDYWSMFMSGSDIEGSCLRVDGNPDLNKYLMGNVMNGDCRMLAIQNAEGITLARCIIRLLWDTIDKIACIFIEEIYPYYINYIEEKALYQLAIKRAAKLNLILVNLEGKMELINYANPLIRIKGGNAPWVYSDTNNYDETNGDIKIINARVLFDYIKEKSQKEHELYDESVKNKLDIYQKGIFFTPSKYATYQQPYGPYSDYYCFSQDPLTKLTKEYTKLLKLGM